jgi:hypothetical protein
MRDIEWKPYLRDRLIAEHPAGFFVIRPAEEVSATPLFCPLCESVMTSFYDEGSYRKFSCCDICASKWAYPNMEKWSDGWRPTQSEAKDHIKTRNSQQM